MLACGALTCAQEDVVAPQPRGVAQHDEFLAIKGVRVVLVPDGDSHLRAKGRKAQAQSLCDCKRVSVCVWESHHKIRCLPQLLCFLLDTRL